MDQDETWHAGRPRPWAHCVTWGPSSPSRKETQPPPIFGQCPLWPNGWMDEDATWYGSRPWPRPHCIRRVPSCTRKMHSSPHPSFRPMSIVATVAHLSYILLSSCLYVLPVSGGGSVLLGRHAIRCVIPVLLITSRLYMMGKIQRQAIGEIFTVSRQMAPPGRSLLFSICFVSQLWSRDHVLDHLQELHWLLKPLLHDTTGCQTGSITG